MNIKPTIEAILFSSGEPISAEAIAAAIDITPAAAREQLTALADEYRARRSGLVISQLESAWQLHAAPAHSEQIAQVLSKKRDLPLTPTALEVLTIIAYNQPTSKAFIEHIRGTDPNYTVNSLCEKGLIEEAGRLKVPGRPIAYRTTELFLLTFGISSLRELPELPENAAQLKLDETFEVVNENIEENLAELNAE